MRELTSDLVVFCGLLRAAGIRIGTGQVEAYVAAAEELAPVELADLYWAGRVTLVVRHTDLLAYDQVFRVFWAEDEVVAVRIEGAGPPDAEDVPGTETTAAMVEDEDGEVSGSGVVGAAASDAERLRHRRFEELTDEELRSLRSLMARIPVSLPMRRTRRTEALPRGRRPDLRRTFRKVLQTDGEMIERAWRHRRSRPRPLVLVLDVSGSMTGYSRALLQFAHALGGSVDELEVFCFGTRLTRITDELDRRTPEEALEAAAERVVDWDGGTQIGASLAALNRTWGRRGVLRGAVVAICSDGLERGDPALLAAEVARLRRFAHRVVWVNPLKGGRDYEPVQRGMRAALPHVDRFLSGHDLASLDELGEVLGEIA